MADYRKYISALRKCSKEHENDRTPFENIIVSELCKDTANLLESLEQGSILDKIISEIKDIAFDWQEIDGEHESFMVVDLNEAIQIIDKYKAEREKV
jgi:hypothetical protein